MKDAASGLWRETQGFPVKQSGHSPDATSFAEILVGLTKFLPWFFVVRRMHGKLEIYEQLWQDAAAAIERGEAKINDYLPDKDTDPLARTCAASSAATACKKTSPAEASAVR